MTIVLAAVLLGGALLAVAYPLLRPRVMTSRANDDASEIDELRERREAALAALHDVEFDYRVGKLSDEDYHALRARLKAQAVVVMKDYDETLRVRAHDEQLDEQIEQEVRALRLSPLPQVERAEFCTNCGLAARAEDLFCARCGARLRQARARVEHVPRVATPLRARRISRGWLVGAGVFAAVWIVLAAFMYFNAAAQAREQNPVGTLRTDDIHSLAVHPANPNIVLFGHHGGLMTSSDGGRNWDSLDLRGDAMAVAVPRTASQRVYVAGHNLFTQSDDGGKTWRAVQNNLPSQDIHAFAALPDDANVLYAYAVGAGLFHSHDGGARWGLVAQKLPGEVTALAAMPGNPHVVFVGTPGGGVWRSRDAGATWEAASGFVGGALSGRRVNALAFDATTDTLYVGTDQGLAFSTTMGTDWTPRNLNSDVAALAVGGDGQTLVVVNSQGQVFRSNDRGVTWSGK